jgi:hypothetical protein
MSSDSLRKDVHIRPLPMEKHHVPPDKTMIRPFPEKASYEKPQFNPLPEKLVIEKP